MRLVAGGLSEEGDEGAFNCEGWVEEYYNGDGSGYYYEGFDAWAQAPESVYATESLRDTVVGADQNADGSVVAAVTSFLFSLIGIDTGYDATTGLRTDGREDGAGCGDAKTDWFVPDKIFGIDVTDSCVAHDSDYLNQIGKEAADQRFRDNVYNDAISQGAPAWAADAISSVYYTAVAKLGGNAYAAAAPKDDPYIYNPMSQPTPPGILAQLINSPNRVSLTGSDFSGKI